MDNLVHILGEEALGWLVDRLVRRFEQGKPLTEGTVLVAGATAGQRSAVDDLLGRRSTGGDSLSISLAGLAEHLHCGEGDFVGALQVLRGPLANRRAQREEEAADWAELLDYWRQVLGEREDLLPWLEGLWTTGLLKKASKRDLETARTLMEHAWQILRGGRYDEVLLASLAVQVTGDSHALDRGSALSGICLRAIVQGRPIKSAQDRRAAWASLGVVIDDLSAPVLCLNVRCVGECSLAPWVDWHLERGEPFFIPWRQVREFLPDPEMGEVFICENPAIVSEAANRLASSCKPLICLNGVPSSSTNHLLGKIQEAGIRLRLRSDFDWAGLKILDRLHQPGVHALWRMGVDDYLQCSPSQPLKGVKVVPSWGEELAEAMEQSGLAAYEEELLDVLLGDLKG